MTNTTAPYLIQAMVNGKWATITTANTKAEANKARRQARYMYASVQIVSTE